MKTASPRSVWSALGLVCVALGLLACQPSVKADAAEGSASGASAPALDTDIKKASYTLGFGQAREMVSRGQGVIDPDAFLAGVQAALGGQDNPLEGQDPQPWFAALQAAVQEKATAAAAEVVSEGTKFREEFGAREGVVTLPSGLMYEVMTEGSGPKPSASDRVSTHYVGTLTTGKVFDSSVARGQPASFAVNGVIKGWTEALQLMGVGSKWKLVIPPELAYGETGAGADIPPNATLVFEVELLEIL